MIVLERQQKDWAKNSRCDADDDYDDDDDDTMVFFCL